MPTYKVVTDQDIGKGLEIAGGKLNALGVKSIAVQGNEIVVTDTKDQETRVQLPAQTVDVKLQGAQLDGDNKLKLTMSDSTELEVDLAKFLNIDTDTKPTAFEWQDKTLKLKLSDQTTVDVAFTEFVKRADIQGDELQSLGGTKLGYLVKEA